MLEDPSARLRELLNCPVLVENDGNLAAYGEAHAGAGRGHSLILHVSVKEGIGAGFVFDGALFRGATGIAGELAHVSIQDDGAQCICGNRGCLTTFEPGPFLVDKVGALYGQQLQYPEIELLVEQGDPAVIRILNDFGRRIGKPLAPVAALLNLDAIVVDARLGAVGRPLATGIQEALAHRVTPICLPRPHRGRRNLRRRRHSRRRSGSGARHVAAQSSSRLRPQRPTARPQWIVRVIWGVVPPVPRTE